MANAYGLLRLPQMPELKDANISNFVPAEIDISAIKYKYVSRLAFQNKEGKTFNWSSFCRERSIAKQRELKKKEQDDNPAPKFKKVIFSD